MSKLIFFDSLKELDYEKLGLVCGLEIHQQLNTGKLFCNCPCNIVPNDSLNQEIIRKLRFSLSETGEIDEAALQEYKKGKYNKYRYNDEVACLVDLDEEPPKGPNKNALNTVLGMAKFFNMTFFDKVQFMRKIIIDGSITSGFQRTALIGFGGSLETKFGSVGVDAINLEEDSCRTIEREDNHTIFALDRQGIPLIEITTGPHIYSPNQAFETAKQIGNILRSFPQTKRGLGTIRQDLNVSISGGARIEIKGAQNLKLIPEIIDNEIKRQIILKSIHEEMLNRKISQDNFTDWETYDVTDILRNSDSKVIKSNLQNKSDKVLALKLFNFKGILGHEIQENFRFATEVSQKNKKHFPQIKGLFHSDELPKYGIEQIDVDNIKSKLNLKENDSFILIANNSDVAKKSLQNVAQIIDNMLGGVISEVRQVDPKGVQTTFSRPMPSGARMYPETDIPDIIIEDKSIDKIKLPELYDKRLERIEKSWKLDINKVETVLEKFSEEELSNLIKLSGKNASSLYNILFEIPKDIKKRDNIEPLDFKYTLLEELLKHSKENDLNTQTIRDIFVSLYKDKLVDVTNLNEYLNKNNLIKEEIDDKEIETKIKQIIEKNNGAPFGALMGIAMKEFKGQVDGKKISEMLKKLS